MFPSSAKSGIIIRDLSSFDDLKQVKAVEKEVWGVQDVDVVPLALAVAIKEAGNLWIGAFDADKLVGFAFGFFGMEDAHLTVHSHMLAVCSDYRDLNLGFRLKQVQRERVLALGIRRVTWTFDPLQSKNAHLNFAKLGVISNAYKPDFYGPATSSTLHRNGTDRLWVTWPIASRRVQTRLQGNDNRPEVLDALSTLTPLVAFNGDGRPARSDLQAALARQRIAIEVPSEIAAVERQDQELARDWRMATRWAFAEAIKHGFLVAEFCRGVRGQQGPGVYLLEKGTVEELVPELAG